ncbi:PKD domain-containing protein [Seonamhaeicola marinus]|uniref:PKD domain-containing protein n=1 Tax=Seonamhaeicola marinus TaxID=1912246 RepID=A0A5D0I4Q6_9FLAO|nr:PKD domain-containing protein [Seonamhaeicola marinus]TYA78676.1 PKD domain-containing protein [Seonamhaeicola marinus]
MRKIFFLTCLFSTFLGIALFGLSNHFHLKNTNLIDFFKQENYAPSIDFTFTNDNTCSGTPITFTPTVTGDGPFSYNWDFGNGNTSTESNPTHTFINLGCGIQNNNVTLTVTDANNISSVINKFVTVQEKPSLDFINLNAPSNSNAPFEKCGDNNTDTEYTINVGNNSASSSCITSYNIDWGDGNSETNVTFPLMHTYMQLGSFNMTITGIGSSGCNNSITYVVKNSNNPIGALIAPGNTTNFCVPPQQMNFAIGSWALNPSDTNYFVNYGDGSTASYTQGQLESSIYYNAANPPASLDFPIPHTYTRFNCPGRSIVTLTISTSCGDTILTAGPVVILDVPTVGFTAPNIACANSSVSFNNTTIAGFTNDCSTQNVYTWDFGDGSPVSRQVNPNHVYSTPGNYTITLTAETPCGSGGSTSRTICVEPILQPGFTFGNACINSPFQITNTTDTSQSCGTETYTWDMISYSDSYCGEDPESWYFTSGTGRNSKDPVINFNTPGIYRLRLTTLNSCGVYRSITHTIHVKKPAEIELDPISDFCASATINPVGRVLETCSPSSEISYEWSFPGGSPSSSTSLNPGSIDYSASGSYTATFSVTNSCGTTSLSRTFTVDLVLSPIIEDKTQEMCSGDTFNIRPFNNSTDNVPSGTTYTWTTPVVSPAGAISGASAQSSPRSNISQRLVNTTNAAATVTYTVSPIAGSCPGPDFTVTITVYPIIDVDSNISASSCFESDDGAIDITISGGIPFSSGFPYTITWTGPNGYTSTDEDISNLEPGRYYLEIIGDDNGFCPYRNTFTVSEPGPFRFTGNNSGDISCFGENDGYINLNISGGNQPYNYTWTKDGVPFSFSGEDPQNLEPGDYTVSVTDANNCDPNPLIDSFTIEEPPLLQVSLVNTPDIIECYGDFTGAIEVTATGGRPFGGINYSWSWTGPNGYRSFQQNPTGIASGTYNLTVSDSSGCSANLSVFVDQNPQILLDYTVTHLTCYNDDTGSIVINGISGGIPPYEPLIWSNLGTGMRQDNLSAGTYTITVTDAINCTRIFPITINNAPVFEINPDVNDVSCYGESDGYIKLNLVGGEAPVTINWGDGASSGDERNNIGPGTYSVTVTDAKGCTIEDEFTIREPLELNLVGIVTDALDCDNINSGAIDLEIQGGTPPIAIRWNNGSRNEDLDNIPPDLYVATITDANGCTIEEAFEVKRFEPLEAPFDIQTIFNCDTREVEQIFTAQVEGGVPPYSLSWSNTASPFVTISGLNNEIMRTNENGLVILTVTDGLGCVKDFSLQVEKPVLDDARFSTSSFGNTTYGIYSIKDPILFTNEATGSIESIMWDFGDGNFSGEENPEHTYITPGIYTITQTVTYELGCVYTKTINLLIEKGYSLIMPNAFTPNNDTWNSFFAPQFIGLSGMKLDIYNTWGNIIYSEMSDDIEGWNGKINGAVAENGNYYYKFSAKTFYGDIVTAEGPLVLIK